MPSSENLAAVAPTPRPEMSATRIGSARTLAATLERDRLERRVSWMTVVVGSLRRRASEHGRAEPRRVRRAIADLEAQLTVMNARLRDLDLDLDLDLDGAAPTGEELERFR
jgi:hypothetical protein